MKKVDKSKMWYHSYVDSISLPTLKKRFSILTATVFLFVFFLRNPNSSNDIQDQINNSRDSVYLIPPEQCPRKYRECSRRVLKRNEARRWIAIWLPLEPKGDVSHLTQIPGWKTVVVGDGFCPQGCSYPRCVFLDPASQDLLGSSLASLLPPNDPAKKNLAYLYAIKQRADFIYDTEVNIRPLHNLTDFFYGNTSGLVYRGEGIFNHYKHYGEHWFRPKGFVRLNKEENNPSGYVLKDIPQPEVQYGLVKVKDNQGPRFQSVVPTVFVGSQSFAPFDSSNTMFNKRAFWGLFTFPGQGSDIARSYLIQALLKYIHGFVGFIHPNAEYDRYLQTEKLQERQIPNSLVLFLYQWQCRDNTSLGTCFAQLASDLLTENIISDEGLMMTSAWLSDLMLLGYEVLDAETSVPHKLIPITNKLEPGETSNSVDYSPAPGVYYANNPEARSYESVEKLCENFSYPEQVEHQFYDILLIVTFNHAYLYDNLYYVEALYRRYFPNVIFCGPSFGSFRSAATALPLNSSVIYLDGIERGWKYFQECTVYAMKMNFNVKGYLQIGDDTLVNTWNLKALSRDQVWLHSVMVKSSRSLSVNDRWNWWPKTYGKTALETTFTHIETMATKPGESREKRFYNQYKKNVKSFQHMFRQKCDFFYIPDRLKDDFIYFTGLFFNSTLLVEAAIPTMIMGLDDVDNITRVSGRILIGKRQTPEKRYNPKDHYLHAFKGRKHMKVQSCKTFICEKYLPTLVREMSKAH